MGKWEILFVKEVAEWFRDVMKNDPLTADLVGDALDWLADLGPVAGRPLVDRVKGSRFHHMKELRPGSSGSSEVRILFMLDPRRRAVLLVAGDKAGNWHGWYRTAIPIAEERYRAHLAQLDTRRYE